MREYWIVDPENKGLTLYCFQPLANTVSGAIATYTYKKDATVQVGIFPSLNISLEQVFTE